MKTCEIVAEYSTPMLIPRSRIIHKNKDAIIRVMEFGKRIQAEHNKLTDFITSSI